LPEMAPPRFDDLILKALFERSTPVLPAASCATTFTKALLVEMFGTFQAYDPVLAMPVAMAVKVPLDPVVE
jgi:hypothetical protein